MQESLQYKTDVERGHLRPSARFDVRIWRVFMAGMGIRASWGFSWLVGVPAIFTMRRIAFRAESLPAKEARFLDGMGAV